MQDEQIIDLYWARSQDAILHTEEKYGVYCRSIAFRILESQEDSDECVNDTWLHAWQSMPPTRPVFLKAFLGRITRNLSLNLLEKKRAGKRGGKERDLCLDELSECISSAASTDHVAEQMVLTDTLNRFLQSLSKEDRVLFVQRYWYLCPVKDLASRTGMGESSVKMRLLRMRRKLEEMLRKEEIQL